MLGEEPQHLVPAVLRGMLAEAWGEEVAEGVLGIVVGMEFVGHRELGECRVELGDVGLARVLVLLAEEALHRAADAVEALERRLAVGRIAALLEAAAAVIDDRGAE